MGVEPTHLAASEPKSDASTNSAKGALLYYWCPRSDLNRRPTAYKAVATTTELQGQNLVQLRGVEPRLPG